MEFLNLDWVGYWTELFMVDPTWTKAWVAASMLKKGGRIQLKLSAGGMQLRRS